MAPLLLGVDLGGTKVEAALVDPAHPTTPLHRHRRPTEAHLGYPHILHQIVAVCREVCQQAKVDIPSTIGMGTPGTVDPTTHLLRGSNTQCLNEKNLAADLSALLPSRWILSNDANCFALAEATWGAGRDYPVVFGVILGTGVGGGIVVRGHLLEGKHGIAGEWGQLILDPAGPTSPHGTVGSIEAHLAGPALEKFYRELSGQSLRLPEIISRARQATDPHAQATLHRLLTLLPKALAMIVDVLDPDCFILGGGLGQIDELYSPVLIERLSAACFAPAFTGKILRPALGDSAGVFGAALLPTSV
jgi:predicted NBD/HSP70 family sugar kinase